MCGSGEACSGCGEVGRDRGSMGEERRGKYGGFDGLGYGADVYMG